MGIIFGKEAAKESTSRGFVLEPHTKTYASKGFKQGTAGLKDSANGIETSPPASLEVTTFVLRMISCFRLGRGIKNLIFQMEHQVIFSDD